MSESDHSNMVVKIEKSDENDVYRPSNGTEQADDQMDGEEVAGVVYRSAGQQLVDFLPNLEDYTPIIPDAVTGSYLNQAGFASTDPRVVRLISLAAQKYLSDICNDALQHCKIRTANQQNKSKTKDRTFTLTVDDLQSTLLDYGINVRKAPYFV